MTRKTFEREKEKSDQIPLPLLPNSRKRRKQKSKKYAEILILISSLGMIFSLGMLIGGFDAILQFYIHSRLQLTPGSQLEFIWQTSPYYMTMNAYFFNITNPDGFLRGEKPRLQEVGPYVYREYHRKENLIYYKNQTVSYYQNRWWIWDQEKSGDLHPSDVINTINIIPTTILYFYEGSEIIMTSLNKLLNTIQEPAIVVTQVSQALFDGYKDPLLDFVHGVEKKIHWSFPNFHLLPKGLLKYDKFAWFYKSNNTVDDRAVYNMRTGASSLEDIGKINWWNYSNRTNYFDPPCNEVVGSTGELWPPGYNEDHIQFFFADLCMSPKLFFLKDIEDATSGIPARRYWASKRTFDNSKLYPENKCYCVNGKCGPTGLLNTQTCKWGSPTYYSFPHFLHADPTLLNDVEGLRPDLEKHMFYMDINSELGLPVKVAVKVQINVRVKPYPGKKLLNIGRIDLMKNVSELILPVFWFEVIATMPKDLCEEARSAIALITSNIPNVIFSLLLIINLSLFTAAVVITIYKRIKTIEI